MSHNRTLSSPRSSRHGRLLRRLVIFAAALLFLGSSGLGLLLFRWWGERGAPPADRLYVQGNFERTGRLVTLERQDGSGNACYRVGVEGSATGMDRVCRGKSLRVWVEDALLDLTIGARGVPRVSIAGVRTRAGDWLGSLAHSGRDDHPRFPLRAQGVPGIAGRVVACSEAKLCLEVHDRLGRLAIARATGDVDTPSPGDVVRLDDGDVLWLGLVGFAVTHSRTNDAPNAAALVFDRIDRLRPRRGVGVANARDQGGDRRWLGRLWHVESPDPSAETPTRFEIYPMRQRYTPHNLSRQRTNLEGEDVLQRLIDGGWLCLEPSGIGSDRGPQLVWRPLERPGCGTERGPGGLTRSRIDDYRRARFGDLAYLAGSLVNTANVALAQETYLEDASELPFVFDWRLSYRQAQAAAEGTSARRIPQPAPTRLWGVRFGTTRQVRLSVEGGRGRPPTVVPRASTARHLLQVLRGGELLTSLYFPVPSAPEADEPEPTRHGGICLGRHAPADDRTHDDTLLPFRPTSGNHHPLGSVAFLDDPRTGTWSPDPNAACKGCQLTFELNTGNADTPDKSSELTFTSTGACDGLARPIHEQPPSSIPQGGASVASEHQAHESSGLGAQATAGTEEPARLAYGESLTWGDLQLRHVERGDGPWLAATDPGTGRRHFAEEFYLRGRLRPLLGDAAALSGVEAAVRELRADGVAEDLGRLELTIDGDLQLAASGIVDALARPQIAEEDLEPHRVSVTAAILDTRGGDLLAVVNWSSQDSEEGQRNAWSEPTTWELGSGQADVLENAALLRRGAIGSTMKITGSYALLNNDGLVDRPEIDAPSGFREAPVDRGRLYLDRGMSREPPSRRRCSTGPHVLPRSDAGFTTGTFVRRFASSCNNFFVMTGFRHISSQPATLRPFDASSEDGAGPHELLLDLRRRDWPTLIGPAPHVQSLAERIRDGLAHDFAPATDDVPQQRLPRSLYGILFRLGFQPRPALFTAQGEAPAELSFDHRAQPVAVQLTNRWFSPAAAASGPVTPALRPGRDFSYPGVPSPGRLDEAAIRGQTVIENYDGKRREVTRFAEGRADVQWSMLMIGQSSVEASAVGLASLFAPAARADGKAVVPCLFRANCGPHQAGAQVIDTSGPNAEVLNQALTAVLKDGTARGGLWRTGRRHLATGGWGGKTGTYQVERSRLVGIQAEQWQRLRAWACGVDGVERPIVSGGGTRALELADVLSRAPAGSALGSRVCEDTRFPLNPAGIHSYQAGKLPAQLDELERELQRGADTATLIYHSFVTLALPARGETPATANPAEGIIVAVLVDRQTKDKSVAIQIGAELAAAVERWVESGSR